MLFSTYGFHLFIGCGYRNFSRYMQGLTSLISIATLEIHTFLQDGVILAVNHLPTKSVNFGWTVNGKSDFVSPKGNFHRKMRFLA